MSKDILKSIDKIDIQKTEDIIIDEIRGLINQGELKPGDKLPPERALAEKFGVGRGYIRVAIKKLEFYGILKTHPQSGTVVSEMGITILDGLISNIINLDKPNYHSLIETRYLLEISAAKLAAQRRTENNLEKLHEALQKYNFIVNQGDDGLEEDVMFHIRIAECAENHVLRSLIMIIAQDIIRYSRINNTCSKERVRKALEEHKVIYQAISEGDVFKAQEAMEIHQNNTLNNYQIS